MHKGSLYFILQNFALKLGQSVPRAPRSSCWFTHWSKLQIRLMGKLTETSKDTRNTLAKFEDKILRSKDTVNLYA